MTPPLPPGSSSGTSRPAPDPARASTEAPAASDLPAVAPLRLSVEGSYLALGPAGFPARAGLLFSYRPNYFLGLGLHADTNFSDHFSATGRLEAIWPAHRYFHLEGALELGARALINQSQRIQGAPQVLSGAAFTFGAEVAASFPLSDAFGISAFARFFYSPGGGFSTPSPDMAGPARGVSFDGGEILVGLRLDFYPPVGRPHRAAPVEPDTAPPRREAEAAPPAPRETLRDFETTVADILRETPEGHGTADAGAPPADASATPPPDGGTDAATTTDAGSADAGVPATTGADREEILALQREIQALTGSVSSLETEIEAATQIRTDLSIGQETGQSFHIRIDRLYDGLTDRPVRLDTAELGNFIREFRTALHDSDQLRLLIQSSTESFGPAILQNLTVFRDTLTRYQRGLPVRASGDALSRSALDEPLTQLGALILEIQNLRSRLETTEPPASQMSLWRVRMARIREHIDQLRPRLSEERARSLEDLYSRLDRGFTNLTERLEEANRNWMVSRALFSHYTNFRAARRPAQALAALRAMRDELLGAPASYRRQRERNIATLRNVLDEFVQRRSAHPVAAWSEARNLAIEILRWIDPSYSPPPLAEAATGTRRRGSSDASGTESPFRFRTGGGGEHSRRDE
ncbi:MAG: hypothetical protein U1F66_02090 [bacterium]